jgi:hypothetical protein
VDHRIQKSLVPGGGRAEPFEQPGLIVVSADQLHRHPARVEVFRSEVSPNDPETPSAVHGADDSGRAGPTQVSSLDSSPALSRLETVDRLMVVSSGEEVTAHGDQFDCTSHRRTVGLEVQCVAALAYRRSQYRSREG